MVNDELKRLDETLKQRFVYVVGTARGGSWLLLETLRLSDEILALPYMTHFANQVWRYRKKVHARLLNQIFRMPCLDEIKSMDHLDEETGAWLKKEINRGLASGDMCAMWRLYPLIHALGPGNEKKLDNIRCWADKANDVSFLGEIAGNFPEARFVFIVRDPRASIFSLSKRSLKTAVSDRKDWKSHLVSSSIYWRRMVQSMLLFSRRHPNRTRMVRFEDLIENPVSTLNSLFRFLGVSEYPEPELLSRLDRVAYGASDTSNGTGRGISKAPLARWQGELSEDDLRVIAALTGPAAAKAGYDLPEAGRAEAFRLLKDLPGAKMKLLQFAKLGYLEIQLPLLGRPAAPGSREETDSGQTDKPADTK